MAAGIENSAVDGCRTWLNAVANKQDYIARSKWRYGQLHNCGATWRETVPVHEVFHGKTVWQGEVEVFDLNGHPKAKRAYGWSHRDGANDEGSGLLPCWKSHQSSPLLLRFALQ